MQIWSAATIARFHQQGEEEFCRLFPCLIDRIALDVVANTGIYTLSELAFSIRRVTWKGIKVDALPSRQAREAFQGLLNTQTGGMPFWYLFNNIGRNKIQLFPAPSVNLATVSTNLYGSEIKNRCIVEYYRLPDGSSFKIPFWFRRRLLKCYVLSKCYALEGKGQNLKASKYYTDKWALLSQMYGTETMSIMNKPRKLILNSSEPYNRQIRPPVLPIDRFGSGVDTGE